jgi:adenylyltransferase/sulfurtransferase
MNKAVSAAQAMKAYALADPSDVRRTDVSLNPHANVITHQEAISPSNAIRILGEYDLIVDCTDRPYTRYLLSDASVLLDTTLVSGAAIAGAGQWAVYGGTSASGSRRACYRCMWPRIVGEGGGRCDEVGVWGPVVGMVGIAMAQEVLRVIIGLSGEFPF